jgi:hypothetical protein
LLGVAPVALPELPEPAEEEAPREARDDPPMGPPPGADPVVVVPKVELPAVVPIAAEGVGDAGVAVVAFTPGAVVVAFAPGVAVVAFTPGAVVEAVAPLPSPTTPRLVTL